MKDTSKHSSTNEDRGLVGGRLDLRARFGRIDPIDHPRALDLTPPLAGEAEGAGWQAARAFVGHQPLEVEIGFGRGRFLAELATANPDARYLGFETGTRWCHSLLRHVDARGLDNLRVVRGDVRALLPPLVADGALRAVYILFPDPWWKKRHFKKRVIAPPTAAMLWRKLAPGGSVWVKSDVPMTIELADEVFLADGSFAPGDTAPAGAQPETERELRCHRVGLPIAVRRYDRVEPDADRALDPENPASGEPHPASANHRQGE